MSKAGEFIRRHNMDYRNISIEKQMPDYLDEMQRGLDGKQSSLLMLPSFVQLRDRPRQGQVICIDAGGTNLRIALAGFDQTGNFRMEKLERHTMPGVEKELTAKQFFDVLAGLVAPYCTDTKEMVLSFAYRAETTEQIDARIIEITKEVKVTGVEGKLLGAEIKRSLQAMGIGGVEIIVLNDSVASALAGRAERQGYGAYTGTILGTGSNSCYLEQNANIGKLQGYNKDGVMMINTEAGSYNRMPRSDLDISFDNATLYPNIGVMEKMASGGYLGALCEHMLYAAAEEGVFQTKAVRRLEGLRTEDVSEYLEDGSSIIAEYLLDEDEQEVRELLQNIVLRAGRLLALQMAAMVEKSFKTSNKICMTVEGTTYQKMPGLKEEAHKALNEYLQAQGYEADILSIDDAVMKGCAIAGLSRDTGKNGIG